jgi:gas vesicle protein
MRYFFAIIGGAMVGACTALLFAPQTGRASRARIRDKWTRYSHDAQDFVEGKTQHLRNKAKGYKHKMEELGEKAPDVMQKSREMIERSMGAIDKAKTAASSSMTSDTSTTTF